MTVHFIGAGPGAADLITVRGLRLIERCPVCLYAGSLVPAEVVAAAPAGARVVDTAPMTLDEIVEEMRAAHEAGHDVARVHSGDVSLYGAVGEQMRRLDRLDIPYDVTPGVPAFAAAAAALKAELTLPEVVQTVILTRGEGRTSMPETESLAALAAHRATLCLFLSARLGEKIQAQLLGSYPPETPTAILYRVSQPDEKIILTELAHLAEELRKNKLTRTTLIMVGEAIGGRRNRSRLYDKDHAHLFRRAVRETQDPAP
jgi:precorrin-4/cobalt-precorrin-4 C11-methyltransferase